MPAQNVIAKKNVAEFNFYKVSIYTGFVKKSFPGHCDSFCGTDG